MNLQSGNRCSRLSPEELTRMNMPMQIPEEIAPEAGLPEWIDEALSDMEQTISTLTLQTKQMQVGYNAKTIQRWAHQKTLKTVWHQNHLFTTRDWVIDFLATEGYKVQNKSLLHTRLLLQYYNQ